MPLMKTENQIKLFAILVTVVVFGGMMVSAGCQEAYTKENTREFHFIYKITVPPVASLEGITQIWLPVPQENEFQEVANLDIQSPHKYTIGFDPIYNNKIVHITAPQATGAFAVSLSFDIKRKETGALMENISSSRRNLFLQPVSHVPRNIRFEEIADEVITFGSTKENGRALYDHTLSRMSYDRSGSGWGRGDAIYACDVGKGNCTDFHSFFNAVARTAGIPARFKIGFPIPDESFGVISGYHCWTEFYSTEEGWIPVDISKADKSPELVDYLFGNLDHDRVLFSIGRDIELVPKSANGPVNFFIYPIMEVGGVRSSNYIQSFYFENIE